MGSVKRRGFASKFIQGAAETGQEQLRGWMAQRQQDKEHAAQEALEKWKFEQTHGLDKRQQDLNEKIEAAARAQETRQQANWMEDLGQKATAAQAARAHTKALEESTAAQREGQAAAEAAREGRRVGAQTETERHNRVMEGKEGSQNQNRPYFTPQTEYDAQGRPIGAMSFDARTGKAERIQLPQGGQFKGPPGNLGRQTIENEAAMDALDNLETLRSHIPTLTGPAVGRAYELGQKIPGLPVNPQFAEFSAASSAFKNSVIKAITGAQMSEPEARRIMQQIPVSSDKPEVWQAKAAQTRKNLAFLEQRTRQDRGPGTHPSSSKYRVEVR